MHSLQEPGPIMHLQSFAKNGQTSCIQSAGDLVKLNNINDNSTHNAITNRSIIFISGFDMAAGYLPRHCHSANRDPGITL